jgi:fructose-1,6-bisphosphatase/inositol monophosphatase family enzyme
VIADELLALFDRAAAAQLQAVGGIASADLRARTDVPGQYALDLVADAAVLAVLHPAGVAVVSEESARTGPDDAEITVVLDPVDGSTNCSRGLPYWAISLCAFDAGGPLCAFVSNQATGSRNTAVRGEGAWRDGKPLVPSRVERVEDSVVAMQGRPHRPLPWKQMRAMGSIALELCDVAAGAFDASLAGGSWAGPWDYLGGMLVCLEAGVSVVDAEGRDLAVTDPDERRQVYAAATPELLATVRTAMEP